MFGFLLGLILLLGIILMVIILLQAGKGGGLAAMGGGMGTETFVGGRQAATILVKATWIGGGTFMFLALVLSVLSSRYEEIDPLLREEFRDFPAAPTEPQPVPVQPLEPAEEGPPPSPPEGQQPPPPQP